MAMTWKEIIEFLQGPEFEKMLDKKAEVYVDELEESFNFEKIEIGDSEIENPYFVLEG